MPKPRARLLAVPAVLLTVAAPAALAAPSTKPRIQPGVTAGGIDLSGLTQRQAAFKLKSEGTPLVQGKVAFGVAGRSFTLKTQDAGLVVVGSKTAAAALKAPAGTAVPFALSHDAAKTRAFATSIAKSIYRPARDATVVVGLKHQSYTRTAEGVGLDVAAAAKQLDTALSSPDGPRRLGQRVLKLKAKVTVDDLRASNAAIVTVEKSTFTLRLFRHLKFDRSYKVAVGQPAYPTPSGLYSIQNKQVNPTWSVPNSPWAGELQGTTVEGGSAANPLKARWMGIVNGVGIHGTGEDYSIGSAASHGCIRMHVADVIKLYELVPVGSKVLIR